MDYSDGFEDDYGDLFITQSSKEYQEVSLEEDDSVQMDFKTVKTVSQLHEKIEMVAAWKKKNETNTKIGMSRIMG